MKTEKFTHLGVLFDKVNISGYTILVPINLVNCNILDDMEEIEYEVEHMGFLADLYTYTYDNFNPVVGLVTPKKDIKENDFGYEFDISKIFDYMFLQFSDLADESIEIARVEQDGITYIGKDLNLANMDKLLAEDNILEYSLANFESIENKNNTSDVVVDVSDLEKDKDRKIEINIPELYKYLKQRIIGQDEAIKQILSTLDRNYNIDNYRNKTNIFLIGPSGSGKTEIFRSIAEKINVPITIEDSEQYSAVGYVGASVDDMLANLYHKADGDVKLAERGILVIDEIDKKLSSDKDNVSGNRILTSLLSLMEGANYRIDVNGNYTNPKYVDFNTNYLNVVLLGACSDLVTSHKHLGFNNNLVERDKYNDIDVDRLEQYGFSAEFLRRVSIYKLNELSIDNLVDIMTKSSNSVLKSYYDYAKKKNINLKISDDAIRKIAEVAHSKGIGASGIKATLNEILNDAFFEAEYNKDTYSGIKVDKESLKNNNPYKLVRKINRNKVSKGIK